MAQVPPSSTNAPAPATNGPSAPSSSNLQQVAPISWEGDRMFNVYIHDYFRKRGFLKAAKELVVEAEIGNDALPPINARQGFLFEWWNVFWLFFSAKTSGQGPENVMLYFHWIQNQQAERNRLVQHENDQRRAAQLPLTTQPPARPMVRPPPLNGVRPPGMVNGALPIPSASQPSSGGQPIQYSMNVPHPPMPPTHQQLPGSGQPQINGIVEPSAPHANNPQRPPSQQQQTRQGPHGPLSQPPQGVQPTPSHPNAVPHLQPSQRQVSRGQHDPMRPPQFHSPTMPPAPPPGPGQQGTLAAHPHMPGIPLQSNTQQQFAHLGRGPPPQGAQPNLASPRNPSQTPTQSYQPLTNPGAPQQGPGSRSATPGGHQIMQQSPALAAREPSQGQGPTINEEMSRRFQQQQQQSQSQPPQQQPQQPHPQQPQSQPQQHQPQPNIGGQLQDQQELMNIETSMSRIPPVFLAQMKMEAGVSDRDIMSLTYEEKSRLHDVFRKTIGTYNGTAFPPNVGRNGRQPAPSQQPPMSGMPMYPQQAPPGVRQPSSVASAPRGQKRSSTSPGDEGGDSTPKEQSPPDKKRLRPSPQNTVAQPGTDGSALAPPMSSISGFPPNHPGGHPGGYPGPASQQQNIPPMNAIRHHGPGAMPPGQALPNPGRMNMSITPGPGMGGHSIPPGMAHMGLGNQQIVGHQLTNTQNQGQPSQSSQQQMQQQQLHYRQQMTAQHLVKIPPGMTPNAANSANSNASPSSTEVRGGPGSGSGASGSGNRQPQQGKPGSMMPPPSPAHRPENPSNNQKGSGMMPPPVQPAGAPPGNAGGVPPKEQTAPSPASRHEGTTGSSPSMRPASTSGAAANGNNQQSGVPAPMPQGSTGGPTTPASGGNGSGAVNTTAPSPSAILTNRISPSAAMNSLPRPQTSGPEANATTGASQNVPTAPPSAPPSASGPGPSIGNTLFTDFFDSMEDQFGLDTFTDAIDSSEFAQWIDMNPLS